MDSERVGFDRLTGRHHLVLADDVLGQGTYWGGSGDKLGHGGGGLGVLSGVHSARGGFVDYQVCLFLHFLSENSKLN